MSKAETTRFALHNDLLLRTLKGEKVERTPVWMMRQAGRYLPEYRQTRRQAGDFLTLCKTPELACEVTLQPLRRYSLDAAILFSDILTIPDAMGLGLVLEEGVGPVFTKPIEQPDDIDALIAIKTEEHLDYVLQAVRLIRAELGQRLPLLGFSGSPWTLACYMVEGRGSKDFAKVRKWLYNDADSMHRLLQLLAASVADYLKEQIRAGVDTVVLFDTWGGMLSTQSFKQFSLHYLSQIVSSLKEDKISAKTPVIVFTKGGGQWFHQIARIGCHGVGVDWMSDLASAKSAIGEQVVLQGNLDPAVMSTRRDVVVDETKRVLDAYGHHAVLDRGHIFNLGHGIQPDANPDNVTVMLDTVREYSQSFHQIQKKEG